MFNPVNSLTSFKVSCAPPLMYFELILSDALALFSSSPVNVSLGIDSIDADWFLAEYLTTIIVSVIFSLFPITNK